MANKQVQIPDSVTGMLVDWTICVCVCVCTHRHIHNTHLTKMYKMIGQCVIFISIGQRFKMQEHQASISAWNYPRRSLHKHQVNPSVLQKISCFLQKSIFTLNNCLLFLEQKLNMIKDRCYIQPNQYPLNQFYKVFLCNQELDCPISKVPTTPCH